MHFQLCETKRSMKCDGLVEKHGPLLSVIAIKMHVGAGWRDGIKNDGGIPDLKRPVLEPLATHAIKGLLKGFLIYLLYTYLAGDKKQVEHDYP